jgi:hypothetical protein
MTDAFDCTSNEVKDHTQIVEKEERLKAAKE